MEFQKNQILELGNKKVKRVYQCDAHSDGIRCQSDGMIQVSTAYHFCEAHATLYNNGCDMEVQDGQTIRKVLNLGKGGTAAV